MHPPRNDVSKKQLATFLLTRPPALIYVFLTFMRVWGPSNQLEAELASNLPREMCKMVEYETGFDNFRFLTWPPAPGHGEYKYIYIYIFGAWIGPNLEFCRPNSTSVEKAILPAQSQGSQNGCGQVHHIDLRPL